MKDYASLKKKQNGSRTIAMIMAVLLVIEMCSLTMLFSRVVDFTSDNRGYVISLTEGAEKSKFAKKDTATTGFIVPTYVADPDIYFIEPQDKINEKDFGYRVYDKDQFWSVDTDAEVFHLTYDQDKDELTVVSDGTFKRENAKVIAPGTSEDYKLTVANFGPRDLKYLIYLEAWIDAKDAEGNDLWIPLNSKFYNSTDGIYFGSDGTSDWHEYDYIDKTGEIRPIASGSSREYHVEWEWPFERFDGEGLDANDAYDTMLGDLAAEGADLRAYIRIKTVAWIEDYWHIYTDVIEGKGTTDEDPDMVLQDNDETSTITAVPAEGYEFVEWVFDDDDIFEIMDGGSLTDPTLTIKPGSDIHAHAKFRPKATTPLPTETTVPPTETTPPPTETTPPTTPPETQEPTNPPTTPPETQEPTIAYWIVDTDVIEGDGTTAPPVSDPAKVEQGSGDTVTITATPAEGYEFIGWEIDGDYTLPEGGSLTDPTLVIKPESDIHAHAKFKPIPKYWIVDADVIEGEGTAAPPTDNPVKVEQGSDDTVTITATPAEGYEFVGWEIDGDYTLPEGGSLKDPTLVIKPGSDVHAHAKFKPIPKYWIVDTDVIEGEGNTVPTVDNPAKVEQGKGETVIITAIPAEGYEFVGWEIDGDYTLPEGGSLTDPQLVILPGSDVHAHAKFKPIPKYWTVDADVIEGEGTATPPVSDPVKVEQGSGDTVTITATPAEGYEFIGWEIDGDYELPEGGSLTDPTLVIKPNSDIHAHAKFKPIPKYWIVDADVIEGEGTAAPPVSDPVKVEQGSGDTVSITATPAEGYEFVGWEIDGDYELPEGGSLSDPNLIIKPNSDIHAHAKFKPVTPPVEYWTVDTDVIEGDGTTSPTKENPVKVIKGSDDTVTIHAEPADGYEFIGWEIDGDYTLPEGGSLTDPTLVIKPGSDVHAHAKFRPLPTEAPTEAPTTVPTEEPAPTPTSVSPTSVSPTAVSPTSPAVTTAPVTPQTGDFTQNLLWIIVAIAAFGALIVLFFVYRKVKKREKADS